MWFLVLCAWLSCSVAAATAIEELTYLTGATLAVSVLTYLTAAKLWFRAIDEEWELHRFTERAKATIGGVEERMV